MRKKISIVMAILFACGFVIAQPANKIAQQQNKTLKIENLQLKNSFYKKVLPKRIFDGPAKLIIIDFWNIWCSSCIQSMPHMDSMQASFGNQIKIVMVTKNSEEQVKKLFQRLHLNFPNLIILTSDVKFNNLFPHVGEPHHVWIRTDRKQMYQTAFYNATKENISAILAGRKIDIATKYELPGLAESKSFLEKADELKAHLSSYSLFLKGTSELTISDAMLIINDTMTHLPTYIHAMNESILNLYSVAYSQAIFDSHINVRNLMKNNRIIGEPDVLFRLTNPGPTPEYDKWLKENNCSYELKIEKGQSNLFYQYMQDDLNRYLDFNAKVIDTLRDCFVLVRTSDLDKIKTRDSNQVSYSGLSNGLVIQNKTLGNSIIEELVIAYQDLDTPIVDGTNYKDSVDMNLNCDFWNINALRNALRQYDLDLVLKKRSIKSLLVSNKNHKPGENPGL